MKKITALLILLAMILCACAPSGPKYPMSDAHYQYGKKAVEIVDQYLDFSVTIDEAVAQMDGLMDSAAALPKTAEDDPNHFWSTSVEVKVVNLSYDLRMISYGSGSYEDVQKYRNELAEDLGIKAK